jgi:hypothetical protein
LAGQASLIEQEMRAQWPSAPHACPLEHDVAVHLGTQVLSLVVQAQSLKSHTSPVGQSPSTAQLPGMQAPQPGEAPGATHSWPLAQSLASWQPIAGHFRAQV